MDLLQIGAHYLNLDRVAEFFDESLDRKNPGADVRVHFGDHTTKLEEEDADLARTFLGQVARQVQRPPVVANGGDSRFELEPPTGQ